MRKRSTLLRAALALASCALLAGCGDDGGGEAPNPDLTPRTQTPQEMVGGWRFGSSSFTNFWGNQSQYHGSGGATSVYWSFERDGGYKQQVYISRRNDSGCLIETWTETVGTTTFDGNKFTIHPVTGRYKAADPCAEKNNFDRPMTDQERKSSVRTYLWKFETNPKDGKTYMMVGFDENTWTEFLPYKP
jgi:hypothetical protein